MTFEERYNNLNPEQKMAVDTIDGPVLVVAGPGSGKTEILSMRVANILKQTDIGPSGILCLTFTDSASFNMRERLAGLIGPDAYKVGIYTFHSFCTEVISRYPEYFFGSALFLPADDITRYEILENIFVNLPLDNPLSSLHPKQGYVFLKSTKDAISNLKKDGISVTEFERIVSSNEDVLEKINPLLKDFPERISKKEIDNLENLEKKIKSFKFEKPSVFVEALNVSIANSLFDAIEKSRIEDSSTPLSEWKRKNITKDEEGKFVFKDFEKLQKMKALAFVYAEYEKSMHLEGYFDFDDMIIRVINALETNSALLSELEERYQYILVDEFQDTNPAQMRILSLLTSSQYHQGRPNIMAVGDDDQSIYKFQGAEIENILFFKDMYRDPVIVTLNKNYRSNSDVLNIGESIIKQSEKSLRNILPEISKNIVSAGNIEKGQINFKSFQSEEAESYFVANEIKKLIEGGQSPKEISVIARKHGNLAKIIPFLNTEGIVFSYQKKKNVLDDELVSQIIIILRFINSVLDKKIDVSNEYLPKILSFPFWQIDRKDVWQISLDAKNKFDSNWLLCMQESSDQKIKNISKFLIDLGIYAVEAPLERVLDMIIGTTHAVLDSEDDDVVVGGYSGIDFKSPFRDFYFGKDRSRKEYINFLSGLKVFIGAMREYKNGRIIRVSDAIKFVDIYEKNNIELLDESKVGGDGVTLLTAHSAKGLEFGTVFVIGANEDNWNQKNFSDFLPFPKNINAKPEGDNMDDKIRLFYVATTRAKHTLYITRSETRSTGRESLIAPFLLHFKERFDTEDLQGNHSILEETLNSLVSPPYLLDEKNILEDLVRDYAMPVTHFNNFLDVSRGGPEMFIEQNLLNFPQAKTPANVYGTAMHSSIEYIYNFLKKEGDFPDLSVVESVFLKHIQRGRLALVDEKKLLEKGYECLKLFLKKYDFQKNDQTEVNFKNQGVCVGEARLSGKIDKISFKGDEIIVTDWKTGSPEKSWDGQSDQDKIKLWKYKYQLIFYKLLIENSKDYSKYKVTKGDLFFLNPIKSNFLNLDLILEKDDVSRVESLVKIVYKKIKNLDFPDTKKYSPDFKGCIEFENDLLEGNI